MLRCNCKTANAVMMAVAVIALAVAAPVSAALVNLTPTGGAVNSNSGVRLNELLTGQQMGIVVGDKIFTGFSYSALGDMPAADTVNVLGFQDPDGNFGITFQGSFRDLPGGPDSDALIRFMVEVEQSAFDRGMRITDAHLFLGGVGVGDNSFFAVDESFSLSGIDDTLNVFRSTLGPGTTSQLSDEVFFDPGLRKLFVTKDINALASNSADLPARASVIDQSFSQTLIPEPATLVLAGLSMAAVVATCRRRG